nr:MAG TPA: hypothetical protein [Inoviridae sp.]
MISPFFFGFRMLWDLAYFLLGVICGWVVVIGLND